MSYTEQQREEIVAMIHLDTWGETSSPPTPWEGYRWAESGYAPEWLSESDLGCDRDQCVTVLSWGWPMPRVPDGYRIAYQYQAGEHECPECHNRQAGEVEQYEDQPFQWDCTVCEATGYIYSDEDCTVVVFAPRYSYGSGSVGCLYDTGPHLATSIGAAADALIETFADALTEGEEARLRANLLAGGVHHFEDPREAGADYCEVTDLVK